MLQALNARHADVETLWVGTKAGMEAELVMREGIAFTGVPAAGLHGVGISALPGNVWELTRGWIASSRILHDFEPDVMFFTGGYVAAPMAVAGRGIPTMVFVPDIEPGLALKVMARFAHRIAVSVSESQRYFSKRVVVTGYPVRADLARWNRKEARGALRLREDLPVLLVAGGSKGARSINEALLAQLPTLLELTQIVHITGPGEWNAVTSSIGGLTNAQAARYKSFAYLHEEMGAALAAADMAVLRAGASVLGELPLFGVPAILVPYPHAWRYQRVNATYLAERQGAIVVEDDALGHELVRMVRELLENPTKREAMRSAMRSLARPEAAQALATQVLELGGYGP